MKKNIGWNAAIEDAKESIRAFERKIRRLKESIEVFEKERDEGKPWPGQGESEVAAHKFANSL